ncbi:MAG TPA: glycogen debranching N-terminal domain-containing protein [Longimicrobiales bacterium]
MKPEMEARRTPATVEDRTPVSMLEAVGYGGIECTHQAGIEDALVLKHDRLFLLVDPRGSIVPAGQCGLGLFHDDTRILSHYELTLPGGAPELLSSQLTTPYHALVDLAVTDQAYGGDSWDPKNVIHIRRELVLDDALIERLTITNYLNAPIDFWLRLQLGADFADIFEVRGWRRSERGQFFAPVTADTHVEFAYRGRDGALLRTTVVFADRPTRLDARGARWDLRLEPNTVQVLQWEVRPGGGTAPSAQGVDERRSRIATLYDAWRRGCARWNTDVAEFNTTLRRAVDDLRALYVHDEAEEIISAGIPWYSTAFGRDSIITSVQTLPLNPRIAIDTLRYLAAHQGTKEDPFTEEQPGRILHELRRGEMARAGEIPHVPYYGTIDATPLWLVLLHETWRWTGDRALIDDLLPHALRALDWIDRYGDVDGDGFVEYARTSEKGLINQGWKDSGDGVSFPDGKQPEPPVALVEVQGYAYDAKRRMSHLFAALGRAEEAERLGREADVLRLRIREQFWMDDTGTFALALDGAKRPVPTVTSNAGHLLWSRVPEPAQARRMAALFASPDLFSGWGIRTVSAAHTVYNPMSYHNGSIWPHDNALVVLGLALYGHGGDALPVVAALHDAAVQMRANRLPELFCGMRRGGGLRPVLYPVSCSPQAWASGAFFMLLQGVLGILPDAPAGVLHIREPKLPGFLRELTIRDLRIGGSRVALRFRRGAGRTLVNVLAADGDPIRVRIDLS